MWKTLLKATDSYKALPQDVTAFSIENVGSGWYIYAHFDTRKKVSVGRYNTEDEAKSALTTIENITTSNK